MAIFWTILALTVTVPVLYLAACRLWIMKLAPNSIQGSDLHMLKWCLDEDTRAWGGFHLSLDGKAPFEALKKTIQDNIRADMRQPDSTYRRGVDLDERRYVFYDNYTPEDVIEEVDEDAEFFRLGDDRKRELVYRFHNDRELVGALFDHTIWDGIRMFNETLTPAIQSTPFDSRWLVQPTYKPVFSELMMLYTMGQMAQRWLRHDPMPCLEDSKDQHVMRHRFTVSQVKALKEAAGCKFTAALVATWADRLFASLTTERKTIRFGLIIGMVNPRFRNNYSILTVDVHRDDTPAEMARSIGRQMRRRAVEVQPLYDLMSLVELQTMFKKRMVDVLFSPAVFSRGTGPSLHVKDLFFYIVPTSMPMYCFACSLDDEITISTTWNSPEMSLDQLSSDATALYKVGENDVIIPIRDESA